MNFISEETNINTESSCWVRLAHLLNGKLAHYAKLPHGQHGDLNCFFGNIIRLKGYQRKTEREKYCRIDQIHIKFNSGGSQLIFRNNSIFSLIGEIYTISKIIFFITSEKVPHTNISGRNIKHGFH